MLTRVMGEEWSEVANVISLLTYEYLQGWIGRVLQSFTSSLRNFERYCSGIGQIASVLMGTA